MRHSTLAGILIAACAFATSQIASAQTLSSQHPYGCRLVSAASPYKEIPGSFSGGYFVNNSGSAAWVMCPVAYLNNNTNFAIYGTSGLSTCYLEATANGGGTTYYTPTSQSSGYRYWNRQLTPGTYSLTIQCYVPNGGAIYDYLSY